MSLTVFLALCILGLDFLIYVLFQWMYGDKRRAIEKKLAAQREAMNLERPGPVLVSSRKNHSETQLRLQKVRARMAGSKPREMQRGGSFKERLA